METVWFFFVQFLRYGLLYIIICLAGTIWILQAMFSVVARQYKSGAMGATTVVKVWARTSFRALDRPKKHLRRYVQNHHPKIYRILRGLFR